MGCAHDDVHPSLPLGQPLNPYTLPSLQELTAHSVDHGHLCRLPSLLLLRQGVHPPLLPTSVPAASEATIHHLRPPCLLHHILLGRFLHRHRPLQRPESTMGYHDDDELFCLRQAYLCDRRP